MLVQEVIAQLLYIGCASAITVRLGATTGFGWEYAVNPDGSCFSLSGPILSDFNDKLSTMNIESGYQCVIWQNTGCQGRHTNAITGQRFISEVCSGGWDRIASSFRCCPVGSWCAGSTPSCT
ncbi:hypothetical protein BJX62DRAFT_221508 [Aspergillus germanicus]